METLYFQTVNFIYHLSLLIWIGGLITLAFFATPPLFEKAERKLAGEIVAVIFDRFRIATYFCATALLVTEGIKFYTWESVSPPVMAKNVFIFLMVLIFLYSALLISPKIKEAKRKMYAPESSEEEKKKASAIFGGLHKTSTRAAAAQLLFGLTVLFLS